MSRSVTHYDDLQDRMPPPTAATASRASPIVWLLVGYMWLFVHRPFEIWPWLATLRIERVFMIFTIVCWLLSVPRFPPPNRLHLRFVLFILVMLASWMMSPYAAAGDATVENYLKYAVFYVLLVTSMRTEKDLRTLLAGYVAVMTLLMVHSLREYFLGSTVWAQGFGRLIPVGRTYDFNDFAGLIVCSLPFAWVLWHEWKTRWRRLLTLGYLALACYCIILTGSRMGFCGLVAASMLACLTSPKRWRLLAMYPILFAVAWMMLPENQKDRYLTLLGEGHSTKFASAGQYRYGGFEQALPLFEERPLFGFGPMGFRAMRGSMPHNLYGQLLAELGAAGAVAFGLILWGVAQNAWEARRIVRGIGKLDDSMAWNTVIGASAAFLLLAFMAWGFNFLFWHVWLWFGGFQAVALYRLKTQAESAEPSDALELDLPTGILEDKCS
jgi:hypothetical protein